MTLNILLKLAVAFSALSVEKSIGSELYLTTFNTGLLKKAVDLVPCVDERIRPQVKAVQNHIKDKNFIIALQEVWHKKAILEYQKMAKQNQYTLVFSENNIKSIKTNGQAILTNFEKIQSGFERLPDNVIKKGILWAILKDPKSKTRFLILNVHTTYSESKFPNPMQKKAFLQIKNFAKKMTAKHKIKHSIIMGDFNSGHDIKIRNQEYDPVFSLWSGEADGIYDLLTNDLQMKYASRNILKPSWHYGNMLVKNAALFIKVFNKLNKNVRYFGWAGLEATLDHIFISKSLRLISQRNVFDHYLKINPKNLLFNGAPSCKLLKHFRWSSSKKAYFSNFSDHYGVESKVVF